ncbi:putative quinol monooxygenase [Natrinema sp. HArc-T2]|uniref:putative quinol monooxygenase n=1 Tax=Natrinema sp. HArc-T2 TaxID=3242701 RepID=UPI00359D0386
MSDVIVYVDQSTVRDGKLDELKAAMSDLVDFVDANEPDILSYDVYFSDDGTQMAVVHTHADSASLAYHMEVAGPKFPPVGEFIDLEAIDVYGRPSEELVRQFEEKASTLGHGHVSIHDRHDGIDRVSVG